MSLIDNINSSVITRLAGGSSSSTGISKINGKGVGSSFGGDAVNLSASLKKLALAFKDSDARLIGPLRVFGGTKQILGKLDAINSTLISLAKRASLEETSESERVNLNSRFQNLVQEYQRILDSTNLNDDTDIRKTSDLADVLKKGGIEPSSNSDLAKAFSALAPLDGLLGYSSISSEDVIIVSQSGSVELGRASGSGNPLEQSLQTRSEATIAYNTLLKFQKDLESDQRNLEIITKEIFGADNFSFAGNRASIGLLNSNLTSFTPEELASELVRQIKSQTSDNRLAQHSDLDRLLAQELLG